MLYTLVTSALAFHGPLTGVPRATVHMSTYAEYIASRSNTAVTPSDTLPPSESLSLSGYELYMASRKDAPVSAAVVQEPAVAPEPEPLTGYAAYLASRANKPAASAPVAPAAKVPTYSAHSNDSTDSPWLDDDKTIVTFMVDGVPKKYRIVQ